MLALELQPSCRLSGEPLHDARVLAEVPSCPLPGVYPPTREQAADLRSPLRVVQARGSGFVQLAHRLDTAVYEQYGFAGDTSRAYRRHLVWFADQVAAGFPSDTSILEIGCGDGLLLSLLEQRGMADRLGIDPGRAAAVSDRADVICGYFPGDLPRTARDRCFGLIVLRHVLEHIEAPREFVAALAARLAPGGELWIEVPDLDSTISGELWTNFYQLHCNYFTSGTLDRLAGEAGLACVDGRVVDVFGGSLLRRYRAGRPALWAKPAALRDVCARFRSFAARLEHLADQLPDGVVGYGAAERTAMALGAAPGLERRLTALHDGNSLLCGRWLAGTALEIRSPKRMFENQPPAFVLFAISHRREILAACRAGLEGDTLVAIADGGCAVGRLDELAAV